MDLRDSDVEAAFRAELRAWLDRTLPELPDPPARDDWPRGWRTTPTGSAGCSTPATRA